jgi:8-oxo-dGTP diphosphatase
MGKLKCNIGEYGFIINKKREFLILKLPINKEFTKEMWMFPGGRLEKDDQPETGLKREVFEETGLKIKIVNPIHTARWGIENPPKYSVFYLCKLIGKQNVKISFEHIDSKWVTFNDIEKILWHNLNSKIAAKKVKKYLASQEK